MPATGTATEFSADSYFATQARPTTLEADAAQVREFVAKHEKTGRKVVLVTSGGTTVPLELNVVRFLDNFSAGTRGATSAEFFLKAGYAVIFMHRQFSLQPFSRHYSHSVNPFLDLLKVNDATGEISIEADARPHLLEVLTAYHTAQREETLLTLSFVSVNEYLWLLRAVSAEIAPLGRSAMYYLAAAVSDFFLPTEKMSQHKIQSGKGSLLIEMDQVPKILKPLVDTWTKEGYIVSFKLETDPDLLLPKAKAALERYGHQVVIANDLNRRKFEVVFVSRDPQKPTPQTTTSDGGPQSEPQDTTGPSSARASTYSETWVTLSEDELQAGKVIEEAIVARLLSNHEEWIKRGRLVEKLLGK